jgi:HK97 family phage portal protein
VLLLTNALDIVNISQNAQQQELLESRKFTDGQVIGRFLGVPKILLMDDSGSSYKSPEAATQEFYMRTISPMAEQKEQEYDSKLLNVYDFGKRRFHVCEQPIFRLDPAGQANILKTRMESGTMTVNEARAFYDLPAVENGDEPLASANLMTLQALVSKGIPQTIETPPPAIEPE